MEKEKGLTFRHTLALSVLTNFTICQILRKRKGVGVGVGAKAPASPLEPHLRAARSQKLFNTPCHDIMVSDNKTLHGTGANRVWIREFQIFKRQNHDTQLQLKKFCHTS